MDIWQSIDQQDGDDTEEIILLAVPFIHDKKYHIMSRFSNQANGYLKANQTGQKSLLLANGMAGTNSDVDKCTWIAKKVNTPTDIYWKFWTNDARKEIVVTTSDEVELKDVNPSPTFKRNQFLPANINNDASQFSYQTLQPRKKYEKKEKKFLGVNKDGTMTVITNKSFIRHPIKKRYKYFNLNAQQLLEAFKVED